MFICFSAITVKAEDLERYRIPNYVTVEEFKALVGKTFLYYPHSQAYSSSLGGLFGSELIPVTITSVDGKTKKDKPFNKMTLTFSYGDKTKTITYYSGNYPKNAWSYKNEYDYKELTLMDYEKWQADNNEIGKEFTNPIVKAKYTVTNVSLELYASNRYSISKSIEKMYTIKNSDTGKEFKVKASDGAKAQFDEDKSGRYHTYLSKVEKPSNPAVKFGQTTTVAEDKSKGITKYSYKDNFIDIVIGGNASQFFFTLKNVSESTQKLIWDEAVYVDYKGTTSKVMHSGIKYSQKEASQAASTIIKGSSIEDIACPISNVRYSDVLKEWVTDSMYPSTPGNPKQIQLMLPIQIKDVTNEYIFIFDIKYEYNYPERLTIK